MCTSFTHPPKANAPALPYLSESLQIQKNHTGRALGLSRGDHARRTQPTQHACLSIASLAATVYRGYKGYKKAGQWLHAGVHARAIRTWHPASWRRCVRRERTPHCAATLRHVRTCVCLYTRCERSPSGLQSGLRLEEIHPHVARCPNRGAQTSTCARARRRRRCASPPTRIRPRPSRRRPRCS